MPGHEAGIVGFLDEEAGVPAQDIGPKQVLHRIQYPGMTDHLVDPGKQHVAAMAHLGLDRATAFGLIVLEPAAKIGHLAGAQGIDREVVAAFAIACDFVLAQHFLHGFPHSSCLCSSCLCSSCFWLSCFSLSCFWSSDEPAGIRRRWPCDLALSRNSAWRRPRRIGLSPDRLWPYNRRMANRIRP